MATTKITDLTAYTNPDSTDVLPIVDVGADITKKVSVGEIVGKISGDVEVATDGTSAIAAGVIVDADISATAAITGTKIEAATTSAPGTVQLTDSVSSTSTTTAATPNNVKTAYDLAVSADATATAALPKDGSAPMTGDLVLDNEKQVQWREATANGTNYVAFKAPSALAGDVVWTLPDADTTVSGYALKSDGAGNLSWGLAGGASGGGTDQVFYENDQTVTTDYAISSGKNAMTAGPVSVDAGVTVTIPSGSVWVIV